MADVSPPPVPGSGPSRGGPRDNERGQLFLVGALALSVILVTLAVLLNTAIYTGNVATRDPGTGSADVIEYRTAANEMAGSTLTGVNSESHADYGALESDFKSAVDAWSVASSKHSVVKGTDAYTTVINTPTGGTRIVQDTNRAFTNKADDANWMLADGVTVRNFAITVDKSTLPTVSNDATVAELEDGDEVTLSITITDSNSDNWDVYVYKDSATGDVTIAVTDPSGGLEKCSISTADPTVDLTDATLAGEHCAALDFWSSSSPTFIIEYSNGNTAQGTYSLVVDETYTTVKSSGHYNTDGSTSPYITRALYSAEVEVVYRSPTVDYSTQFRVAPGEYDG